MPLIEPDERRGFPRDLAAQGTGRRLIRTAGDGYDRPKGEENVGLQGSVTVTRLSKRTGRKQETKRSSRETATDLVCRSGRKLRPETFSDSVQDTETVGEMREEVARSGRFPHAIGKSVMVRPKPDLPHMAELARRAKLRLFNFQGAECF
jgi:hypothetical protein